MCAFFLRHGDPNATLTSPPSRPNSRTRWPCSVVARSRADAGGQANEQLTTPNSKQYPSIVALLVKARGLYDKAGHSDEAVSHLIRLRETYRRRPALMAELNRAHLP